jgi:hypothetical protein
MNKKPERVFPDGAGTARPPRFVMFYDNLASALLAMRICRRLADSIFMSEKFGIEVWKFGALQLEQLCDAAATDAARADMIVIAVARDDVLPPHIDQLMTKWLSLHNGRPGDVILMTGDTGDLFAPHVLRNFLMRVTRKASAQFHLLHVPGKKRSREENATINEPNDWHMKTA